jgi:hypothetical protein
MPDELSPTSSFSARRKWGIVFSVLVSTLAAAALVAMINYLGARHFLRFSLSHDARAQLSSQTLGLLRSLTNDVKVVAYFNKKAPLYEYVSSLLQEYSLTTPHVKVQTVDYLTDPALALKTKEMYHLGSAEDKDLVIFECNGRARPVDGAALGDYVVSEKSSEGEQREFERSLKSFRGEAVFSAAILSVTKPRPMKAYFLQNHGEHSPADEGRWGYSRFNDILKQNFVDAALLSLAGTNTVPADCKLLVIGGPMYRLPDVELNKIKDYLQQGGRMLVCFNVQTRGIKTGLEYILANWGVEVGQNRVRDPSQSSSQSADDIAISNFNWKHPLMNPLRNSSLHMISPRSIRKIESGKEAPGAPKVDELAYTGEKPFLDENVLPEKEPIPLMAAVEKASVNGVFTERGQTRIVVIGDSYLLGNVYIGGSEDNHYFADRLVNWLLDQTEMLQGVPPRKIEPYKLQVTRSDIHTIQALFLAGMPGAILLLGGLVWLRRRH